MQNVIVQLLSFLNSKKWWILAYTIAIAIRIVLAVPLVHDWDGFVFSESAKNMLKGITPYMTVASNDLSIYPDSDRPMTEQWLGYPPLPLLMFTVPYALASIGGFLTSPIIENFVLKIPFILGDILCAYLVMIFLKNRGEKLAKRASLLVLFNPLLIWVSSAWGMFDIWIINFVLLFLLALRSKRVILAGIFLACAPLVKLFPVFFLPAVLLYTMQVVPESKKRLAFFISFALTLSVIVFPFFLSSPQGFLNQNLIMHLFRPPQGIGFIAMLDFIGHIYNFSITPIVTIASIFTLLTILLFNLLSSVYVRGQEGRLLTIILLIYTSTLAFNKVVNEQYFVVLVALLIVITHLRKEEITIFGKRFLGIAEAVVTFSVLFAGVVLGFHFLTFLPPFFSTNYLNASTNVLVFYLSKLIPQLPLYTYPNSLWTYYNAPVAITYIVLIPVIAICFYIVLKGYLQVFRSFREIIFSLRSWATLPSFRLANVAVFLVSLITTITLSIPSLIFLQNNNALKLVDLVDAKEQIVFPSNPKVGTFYNVWWNNPSHQKDLADDAWSKTTLTPEVGYYTSKNSLYVRHIRQMQSVGIDFAIISYHLYDRERYLTFGNYAEKLGFYYAPLIETGDALDKPEYHPDDLQKNSKFLEFAITDDSEKALSTIILSSIIENSKSPAILRIDNKPVIFVYDGHWFYPGFDYQSKVKLAERIIYKYEEGKISNPFDIISEAWGIPITSKEDMIAHYPKLVTDFDSKTPSAIDYREAFVEEYRDYWKQIRNDVEAKVGQIYLLSTYSTPVSTPENFVIKPDELPSIGVFDNEFFYSLSNTWVHWRNIANPETIMQVWEIQEEEQTQRDKNKNWPVFLTVNPTYKDTIVRGKLGFEIPATINGINVYDWTWDQVMKNKADYVLIATWNEFFEGSAIEPTKEYGDYYLNATKQWIEKFRASSLAQNY